jgi:hypothetical protein
MKSTDKSTKEKKSELDEEQREEFPGYPPYPDSDDITIQNDRVSLDSDGNPIVDESADAPMNDFTEADNSDLIQDEASNVTDEDLQALGPRDLSLSLDMDEDEKLLKQRTQPIDFAANDLDIPGSELDDENEALGSEDEENNSYSLGGDNHENLEESRE